MSAWPRVRLVELLRRSSETIAPLPDAEYREITVRLWGKGVVERGRVTGLALSGRRFVAHEDQFIASRIDARNGATGLVPASLDGALVTNDFPLFDLSRERLHPPYLGWLCRTASFVELCLRASEGTTNRVRLKEASFLSLEIALPPLPEQQRLVARVDEIAATVASARRLREACRAEVDALTPSRISATTSDLMTSAPMISIGELGIDGVNPIQIGPFGAQLHRSEFVDTGVPVLNVGNVWPDGLRLGSLDFVSEEKAASLKRYAIQEGDLLFVRSGATLGKVCLVPRECDKWLMTGHLFRVRFDSAKLHNRFAFALLRGASQVHEQIFGQVRGATRPGFNTTLLGRVALPVPPLAEQHRIVVELDALQAEVNALKAAQAASCGRRSGTASIRRRGRGFALSDVGLVLSLNVVRA